MDRVGRDTSVIFNIGISEINTSCNTKQQCTLCFCVISDASFENSHERRGENSLGKVS